MDSIDLIRSALRFTDEGIATVTNGVPPMTQPTGKGGNHPLWVMGHLAYIEASMPPILFGEPHPLQHWAPLFATGTKPSTNASDYPPFDEVLKTFRAQRAKTISRLDQLTEADLDAPPKNVPPGFEGAMKTVGGTLLLIALHQMVHYGQITDARRAAGLPPLM